jgi:hypothetical protein
MVMPKRKRFDEMTVAELEAYERSSNYDIGRQAAFTNWLPETIIEYWLRKEPDDFELREIVKNMLRQMGRTN